MFFWLPNLIWLTDINIAASPSQMKLHKDNPISNSKPIDAGCTCYSPNISFNIKPFGILAICQLDRQNLSFWRVPYAVLRRNGHYSTRRNRNQSIVASLEIMKGAEDVVSMLTLAWLTTVRNPGGADGKTSIKFSFSYKDYSSSYIFDLSFLSSASFSIIIFFYSFRQQVSLKRTHTYHFHRYKISSLSLSWIIYPSIHFLTPPTPNPFHHPFSKIRITNHTHHHNIFCILNPHHLFWTNLK